MDSYPLIYFAESDRALTAWEYFWYKIPYGAPGILTFLVGVFLSYFAFQKYRKAKMKKKSFS